VGRKRHSVNDAISGVPPPSQAHSIQKHTDTEADSFLRPLSAIACGELFQGDDAEDGWDNPASRTRSPGPAKPIGIEANAMIGRFEFPTP